MEHIGKNRLECIGKSVTGNAYFFVKAIGERAVAADILRNKISVIFVGWIAEGLLKYHGERYYQIYTKIKHLKQML